MKYHGCHERLRHSLPEAKALLVEIIINVNSHVSDASPVLNDRDRSRSHLSSTDSDRERDMKVEGKGSRKSRN